jgi:histidinol-phosphatase
MGTDLELAFLMVDAADAETSQAWRSTGVVSTAKLDGSPVTAADVAAETAMLTVLRQRRPGDGFLGEELGERASTTGRRWIADGIDGTRYFATGAETWGTLLALEVDGEIRVGVCSSPLQQRRWWAVRGGGAFTGRTDGSTMRSLHVSTSASLGPDRVACLPRFDTLAPEQQRGLARAIGSRPPDMPWSQQCRVAGGEIAASVWFAGDIWDHAAPSLIVEEAGGRFSDHSGGTRLDTRAAIYSNGVCHDALLDAVRTS